MSVTYDAPAAGEEVVYQNVAQIIDGITGVSMVAHSLFNDHATNPALTVKSTNTTSGSPAFVFEDAAGVDSVIMRRWATNEGVGGYTSINIPQVAMLNGTRLVIDPGGSGGVSKANYFTIGCSDTDPRRVAELIYVTNNALAAATPDVAASAIIGDQGTGDGYFRTLEIDMLARSGTTAWPKIGIELSVEANHAGNGSDNTIGIAIHNYGDLWGFATPQAVDTGLFIGRDDAPFTNFIRCMGNTDDANASTVLFNVGRTGIVKGSDFIPLTNGGGDIGASATRWRVVYTQTLRAENGTVGAPAISFVNDTDNGLYLSGTNEFSAVTAGAQRLIWDASGNVVVGTAALATTATNGFPYIPMCAGVPTGTPTAYSGRGALVIDSTNHKMYFHDGSGWVILN